MPNIAFQIRAYLTSISHTKDRGMRLGFTTNEINNPEDRNIIVSRHQEFGKLIFAPNDVQDKDIKVHEVNDKDKSKSKRLRNALYVFWKQQKLSMKFEEFYDMEMEGLIKKIKGQLNEI